MERRLVTILAADAASYSRLHFAGLKPTPSRTMQPPIISVKLTRHHSLRLPPLRSHLSELH